MLLIPTRPAGSLVQPVGRPRIASANPLARGLHRALGAYTGGQFLVDALTGEKVPFGSGNGVWGENWVPGASGMEMRVSNQGAGANGVDMFVGDSAGSALPWTSVARDGWTLSMGVKLSTLPPFISILIAGEDQTYKPMLRVTTTGYIEFLIPAFGVLSTSSEALVPGRATRVTLTNINNVGYVLYFDHRPVATGNDGGFPWYGGTRLALLTAFYCNDSRIWGIDTWRRALRPQEVAEYVRNPWAIYDQGAPRRQWLGVEAAGGGITASLDLTDAADSLSASGSLAIAAQAAVSDAADSLSGSGALSIVADAAITDAADSLAAVGSLGGLTVDLAVTDAADSLSAESVLVVSAAAALVDTADSLTGSGSLALVAQASVTDAADSLGAAAGLSIVAELAAADESDALTAEATVGGVVASASMTDAADSLLADGELGAVVEQSPSLGWRSRRIEDIPNEVVEAQARFVDGDDILVSGIDVGLALRGAMADLSDDDDVMIGAGMLLPMFVRGPDGLLRPVSSAKTAFYCVCDQCGGFKPAGSLAS